jgi:hypothetical protein
MGFREATLPGGTDPASGRRCLMHDRIFKGLLRAFLPDLLQLIVPQLAPRLDFSQPVFLDKEFFTDLLRGTRRELDLLARIPWRARHREPLLVHVEIEARSSSRMGRRLASYRSQIHARHDHPVLAIVIYVRRGQPGIRLETLAEDLFGLELALFRYFSVGLASGPAVEFLARPEPLAWALAALMDPGPWRRAELKLACLRRIAAARLSDVQRLLLVNCVESYLELNPEEAAELEALSRLAENREVHAMAMTWAEKMIAQGRKEGKREGILEGKREGILEGERKGIVEGIVEGKKKGIVEGREQEARQIVFDLPGERFGAVPARIRRQVQEVDSVDRLRLLAKRILSIHTIDELGLG